jgi:hypothetical protein
VLIVAVWFVRYWFSLNRIQLEEHQRREVLSAEFAVKVADFAQHNCLSNQLVMTCVVAGQGCVGQAA